MTDPKLDSHNNVTVDDRFLHSVWIYKLLRIYKLVLFTFCTENKKWMTSAISPSHLRRDAFKERIRVLL